jgi:ubiquinone biosynthesis protein UbiJ
LNDATTRFFDELEAQGKVPILADRSGTIRFDVRSGDDIEHVAVGIQHGVVDITTAGDRADAVVTLDDGLLAGLATGRENALATLLRGDLDVEGDLSLVMVFQRLFPGPQDMGGTDGQ